MNDADLIAELTAKLTPELEVAIAALCDAMPDATEEEIIALLGDRFPEVVNTPSRFIDIPSRTRPSRVGRVST
jgi:hypothetical protein